jgi:hypothetical protein
MNLISQIPLYPPFSKGEPDARTTALHLSTVCFAGMTSGEEFELLCKPLGESS